jgi:myo-inositol 2-dehydrogenase/D-chiro-inositol 1-dehydrogenase
MPACSCALHQRLAGDVEATRYARGHKALYTLEINGEHASIIWDLHDLHRLQWFDHRDEGPLARVAEHPHHRSRPSLYGHWWVPGLQIGYEHTFIHQAADFLTALADGKPASPTFREGMLTDDVTDAVLESAKTRSWSKVRVR